MESLADTPAPHILAVFNFACLTAAAKESLSTDLRADSREAIASNLTIPR